MGVAQSITDFDENEFINENIQIPKYTFPKSDYKIELFLNSIHCDDKLQETTIKETVKYILENTQHVSFNDLIKYLIDCVAEFEKKIRNEPFVLFIPANKRIDFRQKSNYWISKIVYHILKRKPSNIITDIDSDISVKNILICDDCVLSGSQMELLINEKIKFRNVNVSIHLLAPVISKVAKEKLSKLDNKIMYYNKIEDNLEEYKKNENVLLDDFVEGKKMRIYFDHKIPDNMSTFYYLYLNDKTRIFLDVDKKNCLQKNSFKSNIFEVIKNRAEEHAHELVEIPNIPIIPYKNYRDELEKIYSVELKPEQFKQEYIIYEKRDGRRRKSKSKSKNKRKYKKRK